MLIPEIYPQSVAHITTINECSTILQFTDPRSLGLDPQSRFPIFDSRSCLSSIKPKRKGNDDHDHAPLLTDQVLEEVMSLRRKTNLVPSVFLFSGKREDPWDEAGHFMDSDWAYRM